MLSKNFLELWLLKYGNEGILQFRKNTLQLNLLFKTHNTHLQRLRP